MSNPVSLCSPPQPHWWGWENDARYNLENDSRYFCATEAVRNHWTAGMKRLGSLAVHPVHLNVGPLGRPWPWAGCCLHTDQIKLRSTCLYRILKF